MVLTVGVERDQAPDASLIAHAVNAEALWDTPAGALCGQRSGRLNMVPGMPGSRCTRRCGARPAGAGPPHRAEPLQGACG